MRLSSADPAVRSGKAFARPLSDCGSGLSALPNARSLEKTSVGNELRAGSGRSASANAATNSATSAGRKAVRYTRASSTSVEVNAPTTNYPVFAQVMAARAQRILLVDDDQPIQTLLSFPLQR